MRRENVFQISVEHSDDEPPGYESGYRELAPLLGGSLIAANVYELGPGESVCPYHYEYGQEEWLVVLSGNPSVRHPDGEDTLEPGDVVCFPAGPDGAHKVTNNGDETSRVLFVSNVVEPNVAVYPDSDKVGVWAGEGLRRVLFPRSSAVSYWTGET